MEATDKLRVSYDQNPAIKQYINEQKSKEGDKFKGEIKLMVKTIDDEGVDFVVEAIIPPGYEETTDDDKLELSPVANPSNAMPTMTAASIRKKDAY